MKVQRASQSPERRSEIGRIARRAQKTDALERLLARVKWATPDLDRRILLAWQLGKGAAKSQRYRDRRKTAA
jgi:hypothetical protein